MSWFEKLLPNKLVGGSKKGSVPEGLWIKCSSCGNVLYKAELEKTLNVCPKCGNHMRVNARQRLDMFLDKEGREEIGSSVKPTDFLKFKDSKRYKDRLSSVQKKLDETDALVVMKGTVKDYPVVTAAFEFSFIGGSMGSVVGERFVQGVQYSLENNVPFICFAASGGARMQEGLMSLMQMAKTSAAVKKMSSKGIPFISVLTDPTMGGVSASFAMLGDLNIAEPNALIGFAGPRVIEQTVRETLPEGFQRAEFLIEKGAIDMIVDRREMRDKMVSILSMLQGKNTNQVA